jgi:uncharacterized protein (TIGR02996 family)
MAMTLRYDIGQAIRNLIHAEDDELFHLVRAKTASRWAGIRRARFACWTFSLKLPRDLDKAWRVLRTTSHLSSVQPPHRPAVVASSLHLFTTIAIRGCRIVSNKLTVSLGLPHRLDTVVPDGEAEFISSIDEAPGRIDTWMAYADWLIESDDRDKYKPQAKNRGELIAAMLAKKSINVKYGVPEEWQLAVSHVEQGKDLVKKILDTTVPRIFDDI